MFIGHHGAYVWDSVWFSDDGGDTYNTSSTIPYTTRPRSKTYSPCSAEPSAKKTHHTSAARTTFHYFSSGKTYHRLPTFANCLPCSSNTLNTRSRHDRQYRHSLDHGH